MGFQIIKCFFILNFAFAFSSNAQILNSDSLFNYGLEHYKIKNYSLAMIFFEKAIVLDSTNIEAWTYRGNIFNEWNEPKQAIIAYTIALKTKPDVDLFYNRSMSYSMINDTANFIKDIEKAITINPKDAELYFAKANYLFADNPELAIKEIDKAIKYNPSEIWLLIERAKILAQANKLSEAIEQINIAISQDTTLYEAIYNRALLMVENNQIQNAMSDFNLYLSKQPNDADAYSSRAILKTNLNDTIGALNDFKLAISIDKFEPERYILFANFLYSINNFSESILNYSLAIDLDPENAYYYYLRGKTYAAIYNKKAKSDFAKAVYLQPNLAEAWTELGIIDFQDNKIKSAIQSFNISKNIDSTSEVNYFYLAQCAKLENRHSDALKYIDTTLQLIPQNVDYILEHAKILVDLEDYNNSIQEFSKVIKVQPDNRDAYFNLALAQIYADKKEDAMINLNKAIKIEPYDHDSYFFRGYLNLLLDNPTEACEDWFASFELGNPSVKKIILKYCR